MPDQPDKPTPPPRTPSKIKLSRVMILILIFLSGTAMGFLLQSLASQQENSFAAAQINQLQNQIIDLSQQIRQLQARLLEQSLDQKAPVENPVAPTSGQTLWLKIDPVQCGGNPWEQDWVKMQDVEPVNGFPYYQEDKIIIDYFAKQNIGVKSAVLREYPSDIGVCAACTCPRGDTLYLEADETNARALVSNFGFKLSDLPPPLPQVTSVNTIDLESYSSDETATHIETIISLRNKMIELNDSSQGAYTGQLNDDATTTLQNLIPSLNIPALKSVYNYPPDCLKDPALGSTAYALHFYWGFDNAKISSLGYCPPPELQELVTEIKELNTCLTNSALNNNALPCGITDAKFTTNDPLNLKDCDAYSTLENRASCFIKIAVKEKNTEVCKNVKFDGNNCLSQVALASLNPDLCETLEPEGSYPQEDQDLCLKDVGIKLDSPTVCNRIYFSEVRNECLSRMVTN
ncbi:MAG TPA: hypothetical protein DDX47_01500 [Candidatus Jacksonbacteria bacterium]|nr:MAG: hypothetical protein UW45_C0037G0008 [Parcubacteria group bacterium GW2011_GWC2_44_22]HBH46026.1 hypothetical protein [Candidatus Jacksonbacteria bacterium]